MIPLADPVKFDESDFWAKSPAPSSTNLNRSSFSGLKLRAGLTTESTLASLAAASYPRFQSLELRHQGEAKHIASELFP